MAWRDLCVEVLGYVPDSKVNCLEYLVEKFVSPSLSTCGVLYSQRSNVEVPKRYFFIGGEMPQRFVIDTNVFDRILTKKCCSEFEYWRNCTELLRRIEEGKAEGKILNKAEKNIDTILSKSDCNSQDAKELMKKTILSIPNLAVKNEPRMSTVLSKYSDVIEEYRLKPEDYEDLSIAHFAEKEGALIATYDSFFLAGIPELPKAFTPEELLGFKTPPERCFGFCDYAARSSMIVNAPLAITHPKAKK